MWIELEKRNILSHTLAATSDAIDVNPFKFSIARRLTTVTVNSHVVVSTDGASFLRFGEHDFKVERKGLRMFALVSGDKALQFNWKLPEESGFSKIGLQRLGTLDTFVVRKYETLKAILFTRTRLDMTGSSASGSPLFLIACAAFFWTYYENDRMSFG